MAAVDVARHLGARVIAGVGSDDHAAVLRSRGVTEIVNYRREDLRDRLKVLGGGEGIDVAFDNVGGSLLKNFSIIGVFAGAWEDKEPEAARLVKETLMSWVADEKIQPHIGMVVPMEAIREAMMAIQSRTSSGRVVVTVR